MICPHCSQENPETRTYCRACAKPLRAGARATRTPEPQPASVVPVAGAANSGSLGPGAPKGSAISFGPPQHEPLSYMAVASLALSVTALIIPIVLFAQIRSQGFSALHLFYILPLAPAFVIAGIVFGHVSRSHIANSLEGLKGTGIAFAGLISGYLQLIAMVILLMALAGGWNQFQQELNKKPDVAAALASRMMNGNPNKVTPEKTAQHEENVEAALRLIQADESAYLAANPGQGYSCYFYQIAPGTAGAQSELDNRVARSGYEVKVDWCTAGENAGYAVLAVPRSESNPADAPVYCLDWVNGIRKYRNDQANDVIGSVMHASGGQCRASGEPLN